MRSKHCENVSHKEVANYVDEYHSATLPSGVRIPSDLGHKIIEMLNAVSHFASMDSVGRQEAARQLWLTGSSLDDCFNFRPDLQLVVDTASEVEFSQGIGSYGPTIEELAAYETSFSKRLESKQYQRDKAQSESRLAKAFTDGRAYIGDLMRAQGYMYPFVFQLTLFARPDPKELFELASKLFRKLGLAGYVTFLRWNGQYFNLLVVGFWGQVVGQVVNYITIQSYWHELTKGCGAVFFSDPLAIGELGLIFQLDQEQQERFLDRIAIAYVADSIIRFRGSNALKTIRLGPPPRRWQPNLVGTIGPQPLFGM